MGAVKCLECGQTLISRSRHDYQTCGCPQSTMVDGGEDYTRSGGKDMNKVQSLHPILLEPVDRKTGEVVEVPKKDYTLSPTAVFNLVKNVDHLLSTFPDDFQLAEARRDSPFRDDILDNVIAARAALREIRDDIYKRRLAHEAKTAARSRKAGAKEEQPKAAS